jgi:hypothetical protein
MFGANLIVDRSLTPAKILLQFGNNAPQHLSTGITLHKESVSACKNGPGKKRRRLPYQVASTLQYMQNSRHKKRKNAAGGFSWA